MTPQEPTMGVALMRGTLCKCPSCGEGALFRKYLKVVDSCSVCGEELRHHRADDMPAYIVMSIVGHVVVGLLLWVEFTYVWPTWLHLSVWLPLTIILTLGLLPPVKGFIVAVQWALRMHGFATSRAAPVGSQRAAVVAN